VLLARDVIDDDLYEAGIRYAFLFGKVFGRTKIVAHYADALVGTRDLKELDDDDVARFERALRDCWQAVQPLGPRAKRLLDDVAVYERFPGWILADHPRTEDRSDRRLLLASLGAIGGLSRGSARPVALRLPGGRETLARR